MSKRKGTGRPPKLTEDIVLRIHMDWVQSNAAGEKLPSATALMKTYAVSRNTVEAALGKLAKQKLIELAPFGRALVSRHAAERWKRFRNKQIGLSFRSIYGTVRCPYSE